MLRNVIKPVSSEYFVAGPSGFRRHAFPDISRAGDLKEETSPGNQKFRRIFFDRENSPPFERSSDAIWKSGMSEALGGKMPEGETEDYRNGFRNGEENAVARLKSEADALFQLLRHGCEATVNLRKKSCREMERETVELAMAIARKILHREVGTRPEAILDIVREAMGKAAETAGIKIRVNPSDFRLLESRKSELIGDFEAGDSPVFEEDEKIEKGGCYIETGFGDIDARIEQRILHVEAALRREWEDSGELEGVGS